MSTIAAKGIQQNEEVEVVATSFATPFFQTDIVSIPSERLATMLGRPLALAHTSRIARRRLESLFIKEPTTIVWLDSFKPGVLLCDVGANIGLYTVYAAAVRGARVVALEPEALNFAELSKNIQINQLGTQVTAWCVAAAAETEISYLLLGPFGAGQAHHDFGRSTWDGDKKFGRHNYVEDRRERQGSMGLPLDALFEAIREVPTHLKIDVDGTEGDVIAGARATLAAPSLSSVLIEIDFRKPEGRGIVNTMTDLGYHFSTDQMRVTREGVSSVGAVDALLSGGGYTNVIFFRDAELKNLFADFRAFCEESGKVNVQIWRAKRGS